MKLLAISFENLSTLISKCKAAGVNLAVASNATDQSKYDQILLDVNTPDKTRKTIKMFLKSTYFPFASLNDENFSDAAFHKFMLRINLDESIFTRRYEYFDEAPLPTEYGDFTIFGFRGRVHGREIVGLRTKDIGDVPYVRFHSMCHTGDIFRSLKCDCGDELENALNFISKHRGIFIYTPEEGRDIGVLNKISVYKSQSEGLDTVEAQYANRHPNELRTYDYIKDILEHFSVSSIKLISNNPEKRLHVELAGIVVADVIKLPSKVNPHNEHYLKTKMVKNGHDFKLEFSD